LKEGVVPSPLPYPGTRGRHINLLSWGFLCRVVWGCAFVAPVLSRVDLVLTIPHTQPLRGGLPHTSARWRIFRPLGSLFQTCLKVLGFKEHRFEIGAISRGFPHRGLCCLDMDPPKLGQAEPTLFPPVLRAKLVSKLPPLPFGFPSLLASFRFSMHPSYFFRSFEKYVIPRPNTPPFVPNNQNSTEPLLYS